MIKTHYRRWYLAHKLYYFTNRKPGDLVWLDEFIDHVLSSKLSWTLFLSSKTEKEKNREISEMIEMFEKETVFERVQSTKTIHKEDGSHYADNLPRVRLGPHGWDVYAISYLIFYKIENIQALFIFLITLPAWIHYWDQIKVMVGQLWSKLISS